MLARVCRPRNIAQTLRCVAFRTPTASASVVRPFSSQPQPTTAAIPPKPDHPQPDSSAAFATKTPTENDPNAYAQRSHHCGQLNLAHVGQSVTLCGWLQFQRMRMFLTLRDGHGETQVLIPGHLIDALAIERIPFESIVRVSGVVRPRPPAQQNARMATGAVEVHCEQLHVLNAARRDLPMDVRTHNRPAEQTRLQFRYIDLRFADMQRNLRLRSRLVQRMRRFLHERAAFVEVETPTLFRRTPGGAQEFVVPSRKRGQFYSLVQSPQQFKQMLMAGAVDRYFQVARCYRDESTRPDRQPEFTQLDVEMSFVDRDGIMRLVEDLLVDCWPAAGECAGGGELRAPFERMTYADAMEMYGCDKPDTRFGMRIRRVLGERAHAIVMRANTRGRFAVGLTDALRAAGTSDAVQVLQINRKLGDFCRHARAQGFAEDELRAICEELQVERNETVLLRWTGSGEEALLDMGRARLAAMDFLEAHKLIERPRSERPHGILWLVDFPMFAEPSPATGDGTLETVHHPFTAAHPDDEHLLDVADARTRIRSQAYDLVLNGQEIGGGSIRMHDARQQRRVLDEILRIPHEHLAHLLDALDSGCPPHGGIALGLDRLAMVLCGARSIRDVIAFPKAGDGRDALSNAPVPISDAELRMYHINVRE